MSWKKIFSDSDLQKKLSGLVRGYLVKTLDECFKNGAFDRSELNRVANLFKNAPLEDYSETNRLVHMRISTVFAAHPISIANALRKSAEDIDADELIRKRLWEYREFDGIARQIALYRNAWSHHLSIENKYSWELLLSALIIRLCELGEDDKNQKSVNSLRDVSKSLLFHPDGNIVLSAVSEKDKDFYDKASRSETTDATLGSIDKKVDLLTTLILDQRESRNTNDIGTSEDEEGPLSSGEALSQKLRKIRNQIEYEYEFDINYPGPDANVLKASIVDEIIDFDAKTLKQVRRLPEFEWSYREHAKSMEMQLRAWGDRIERALTIN